MPIERRDPVPRGKYWVDTLYKNDSDAVFQRWIQDNYPNVKIRASQQLLEKQFDISNVLLPSLNVLQQASIPYGNFYIFEVVKAVPLWPIGGPGFPNILETGVTSFEDVIQAPKPEDYSIVSDIVYGDPYQANTDKTKLFLTKTAIGAAIAGVIAIPVLWLSQPLLRLLKRS